MILFNLLERFKDDITLTINFFRVGGLYILSIKSILPTIFFSDLERKEKRPVLPVTFKTKQILSLLPVSRQEYKQICL